VSNCRRRTTRILCAAGLLAVYLPATHPAWAAPACAPVVRGTITWPYRVDTLLTLSSPPALVALVGSAHGPQARFLPRDTLLVASPDGRQRHAIALPAYTTPPGLAVAPDAHTVYVVLDSALWLLDPASGRILSRRRLDIQALGWPAAVTAGTEGRLYLAGQHYASGLPTAMVEALQVVRARPPRVLWRSRLGVTHAGIWVGIAGGRQLAAYVPNANDVSGMIVILDARSGTMSGSYPIDGPPAGIDSVHRRIFLVAARRVQALALFTGATTASAGGDGPLAVDPPRGLVAFVRTVGGRSILILASARTLRLISRVPLDDGRTVARALAFTTDGSRLVAGLAHGVAEIDLRGCAG